MPISLEPLPNFQLPLHSALALATDLTECINKKILSQQVMQGLASYPVSSQNKDAQLYSLSLSPDNTQTTLKDEQLPLPKDWRLALPDTEPKLSSNTFYTQLFARNTKNSKELHLPTTGLPVHAVYSICSRPSASLLQEHRLNTLPQLLCLPFSMACTLGLAVLPAIQQRSQDIGVVIATATGMRLTAMLLFKEKIWGILSIPLGKDNTEDRLLALINDFRLGWLPPELLDTYKLKQTVIIPEGTVATALPTEAEGFKPLYLIDNDAPKLLRLGQLLPKHNNIGNPLYRACIGLLMQQIAP